MGSQRIHHLEFRPTSLQCMRYHPAAPDASGPPCTEPHKNERERHLQLRRRFKKGQRQDRIASACYLMKCAFQSSAELKFPKGCSCPQPPVPDSKQGFRTRTFGGDVGKASGIQISRSTLWLGKTLAFFALQGQASKELSRNLRN